MAPQSTPNTILDALNIDGGVHLQCSVAGYQFPKKLHDDWCFVRVAIRQGSRVFEKIDPALEAHDLSRIRNWFRALADLRLPRVAHLTFVEPCLGFEFLGHDEHGVRFAVHLGAELRPPFSLEQLSEISKEWVVVFRFDAQQLADVASAVDTLCETFAVRSRVTRH